MSEYKLELYHHGVKGMKWGIRRNRRKLSGGRKKSKMTNWSDDAKEVANIKKKKLNEMSNAELKKLTQRDELVNKYKKSNPSSIKKGIAFLGAAAGLMGTTLAIYNNTGPLINAGKDVGGKIIDKIGDFVIKDISKHL